MLDLQRQGLTPESVPQAGQKVLIQLNGNVADDVTDEVHPDVAYMAALAARVVGLDIAGIDLVCEDISRPLEEQRGAIIEVNASPGLLAHIKPAAGPAARVGKAIVDHLFADGRDRAASRWSASPAAHGRGAGRAPGRHGAATCPASTSAWPTATACSSTAAASPRRTAPASTPASAC